MLNDAPIRRRSGHERMDGRGRDYFFPPGNSPGLPSRLAIFEKFASRCGERKLLTLFTVSQIYSRLVFIRTTNRPRARSEVNDFCRIYLTNTRPWLTAGSWTLISIASEVARDLRRVEEKKIESAESKRPSEIRHAREIVQGGVTPDFHDAHLPLP